MGFWAMLVFGGACFCFIKSMFVGGFFQKMDDKDFRLWWKLTACGWGLNFIGWLMLYAGDDRAWDFLGNL